MKRFYTSVSLFENGDTLNLTLDGKTLRTPQGQAFIIPSCLAQLIENEWTSATTLIEPSKMPATQIAMTAQDLYDSKATEWNSEILSYLNTDLLCYWTNNQPQISKKQEELFGSILRRLEDKVSKKIPIHFELTHHIAPHYLQDMIKDYINRLDKLYCTAFYLMTLETGSTLLTLAMFYNLVTVDEVYTSVFLDEIIKAEIYNEDFYGSAPDLEKKQIAVKNFLTVAQTMIQSLSMKP